ncbi:alkaline phosphatase D family protein [Thauera aromatica]|uniref:alkaline phosphatase D family protein n=1 Tax=Thauera aromatica TaxID=59405 RepID=UPI001FFD7608|nr:alkaline phosphatase D family protein [Thauera aromatica]MCK2089377.1 alkaline phosphatase D family protein [Thauera aromatica]
MTASKITASTPLLPLCPGIAWRALRRLALPWLALYAAGAGAATLAGGPMAGPATSERVGVWLMTDAPAQVQLEYWAQGQPGAAQRSAPVATRPERGHTARIDLDGLRAATRYAYRVPLGDVELFLLDDRYHRDDDASTDPARTMLGAAQLEWLKGALRDSHASFKLVTNGSRMLSDRPSPELRGGEGWHNFPAERQAFLDWLAAERIDGVLFVSGDIHYTHLTERERPGTYPLTELTCSPLTARVHPRPFPVREVPGTLVTQRNFCTLQFSGPAGARLLRVAAWDAAGTRLWEAEFPAARLRTP